jgi:two-component system, NtrC family, sensor kinase
MTDSAASVSRSAPLLDPVADGQTVLSVRIKGLIVFGALLVYAIAITLFVLQQKSYLQQEFDEIQKTFEVDGVLKQVDLAVFHTAMAAFLNTDGSDQAAGMQRIHVHHQLLLMKHAELTSMLPSFKLSLDGVNAALAVANRDPSKASMNRLIQELSKSKSEFTLLTELSKEKQKRLSEHYQKRSDTVGLTVLLLGMLGLGCLGAIAGVFFRRLTEDLHALQTRALEIVKGYRGEPIPITRHDEVGQLMAAVNHMASELDTREKELMVERQKYFHQEKMAAIGSLAAGVAHEIGNPIAAISGIAQAMSERRAVSMAGCSDCASSPSDCNPELIQTQIKRLAAITREISDFASPRQAEPQLLDLNGLLRSTSSLIRYDKRLQRVTLQLDLDSQLPAVYGVADQLTQVFMNLLINAMDAMEGVTDRTPAITISTRVAGERACLTVADNGHGMEEEVLRRACEAFFTTKPAGKGTGLGLSLCYSIIRTHGGSLELASASGVGTSAQVFLPLDESAFSENNS